MFSSEDIGTGFEIRVDIYATHRNEPDGATSNVVSMALIVTSIVFGIISFTKRVWFSKWNETFFTINRIICCVINKKLP